MGIYQNIQRFKDDLAKKPFLSDLGAGVAGSKKGAEKMAATFWDVPASNTVTKIDLMLKVVDEKTKEGLGYLNWGLEIALAQDPALIDAIFLKEFGEKWIIDNKLRDYEFARVTSEYGTFKDAEDPTSKAAEKKFDKYIKNPGTPNAPKNAKPK